MHLVQKVATHLLKKPNYYFLTFLELFSLAMPRMLVPRPDLDKTADTQVVFYRDAVLLAYKPYKSPCILC